MRETKKPNKHAKGDGSTYQRKSDGMWVASIELPSHDGTRRRKVVTASTEARIKEKLKLLRREKEKSGDLPTAGQTLGTWVNVWYTTIAVKKIRPKTAAVYRTMIRQYIIPAIGKVRLDKLTPEHVRKLEQYITETKGLSSTTAMQAHRVLSVALKYAEREGRVTRNVATFTDSPRRARPTMGVLTAADGITVLQSVAHDRLGSRWAAALLTGARQGELLGLEIDRVTDVLDLSWQLQRISWEHGCANTCGRSRGTDCPKRKITAPADWEHRHLTGGLWLSRPKSSAGWRVIPLVEPLRSIINRRIEAAANEPNPHGLVWSQSNGQPVDPSADNRAWHQLLAGAEVNDVRLHDARHTTASLLLEAGVPEQVIMKILGHNSYVVTRAYQTIDRVQLDNAMNALSARLALPQ
jgi:integrase